VIDISLVREVADSFCTPKGREGVAKCFRSYLLDEHAAIEEGMQHMINSTALNNERAIGYLSGFLLGWFIAQHPECEEVESMLQRIVDFRVRAEDTKILDFEIKKRERDGKGHS
jgi:hypothetical protein